MLSVAALKQLVQGAGQVHMKNLTWAPPPRGFLSEPVSPRAFGVVRKKNLMAAASVVKGWCRWLQLVLAG